MYVFYFSHILWVLVIVGHGLHRKHVFLQERCGLQHAMDQRSALRKSFQMTFQWSISAGNTDFEQLVPTWGPSPKPQKTITIPSSTSSSAEVPWLFTARCPCAAALQPWRWAQWALVLWHHRHPTVERDEVLGENLAKSVLQVVRNEDVSMILMIFDGFLGQFGLSH